VCFVVWCGVCVEECLLCVVWCGVKCVLRTGCSVFCGVVWCGVCVEDML